MSLRAVHLGHWRALERTWLELDLHDPGSRGTAVITAGFQQSRRLAGLLSGTVAGMRFFPGFPQLAAALSGLPASGRPSAASAIGLACGSEYDIHSAAPAAALFEDLLDKGITPAMFQTSSLSLRNPDAEVERTSAGFERYVNARREDFPFTDHDAMISGPELPERFSLYVFYGYYDLNPGQRMFLRRLSEKADVVWFSPVHPSHHWRKAFERTLNLLKEIGGSDVLHRVDAEVPLSPIAQFGQNLLTGRALVSTPGITVKGCGSGSAFTAAVARELEDAYEVPGGTVVVASGEDPRSIRTELHCRGIPCADDLAVPAGELPWGDMILRLNSLPDSCFHHIDIERLLATGMVTAEGTPGPAEYAAAACRAGARFGIRDMVSTGFAFTVIVRDHFEGLPFEDLPQNYLERLFRTLRRLCPDGLPEYCFDQVLSAVDFRIGRPVPFEAFRKMLKRALEEPVRIAEGIRGGVRVLPPEKVRGALFGKVILTGMEEGRFPSRAQIDPRFPPAMKDLLQMPSADTRETEEAFLLRQVFEAAAEELVILVRTADETGGALEPSPFIAPLRGKHRDRVGQEEIPSTPSRTLVFPADPPFLASSVRAQRERVRFDPSDPDPEAVHCGMIGPGTWSPETASASLLESYLRDPFEFMRQKLWAVEEQTPFPVRSEPDPRSRGTLVHRCVEAALGSPGDTLAITTGLADECDLEKQLGSKILADIWSRNTAAGLDVLFSQLSTRGWSCRGTEVNLYGEIAGSRAEGRVDLLLEDRSGALILADLKTGRPRRVSTGSLLKNNLLQLPFYHELALQNGMGPVNSACYIHLQGSGTLTILEHSGEALMNIAEDFRELVRETMRKIHDGAFPFRKGRDDRY